MRPEWQSFAERAKLNWPLWCVLVIQIAITIPWLSHYAPSNDEALYLRAGHEEWAHWLHGVPTPRSFPLTFSGAPVLWPPLGALADSIGGLTAARALCMILMLGVTALTYFTALRLAAMRRDVAAFAAALAGLTGLASFLGGSATFEPLALFLLMLSTWLAVRAKGNRWVYIAAGLVLALANAAKYGTVAWDLVVIGLATLHNWTDWKSAARRGLILGCCTAIFVVGLLAVGGKSYVHGITATTLGRGSAPATIAITSETVIFHSFMLIGGVLVLAILAIAASGLRHEHWSHTCLLGLLTLGLIIPMIDQARLGQLGSLDRNTGFGLPFGAIAAGFGISYTIDWISEHSRKGPIPARAAWVAPVVALMIFGLVHPWQASGGQGVARRLATLIQRSYRPGTYIGVPGSGDIEQYYLPKIGSRKWVPLNKPRFTRLLRQHRISVIVLHYSPRYPQEEATVLNLISHSAGWSLIRTLGHGQHATEVWVFSRVHSHMPSRRQ
ncbi:MAG: hypothetical protein C5B60_04550 [Chloroflexi bacterium]|nr:MAG: hypothetical protein C5B60_04550 [Chloroflexota bacterium]